MLSRSILFKKMTLIKFKIKLSSVILMVCLVLFSGINMINAAAPSIDSILNKTGEKARYQTNIDLQKGYPAALVGRFIGVFLGILGTIFTILIVYAGYLWFMAQGEAAALVKAKEIMTRAVIGLAIVVSAYVITYFVTTTIMNSGTYMK